MFFGPGLGLILAFLYPLLAIIAVLVRWRGVAALERIARAVERREYGQMADRFDRPSAP